MAGLLAGLLCATGFFPLWWAWHANRRTSLLQTVNWVIGCWAVWGSVAALEAAGAPGVRGLRFLALCLSGCCGVAVLGARRPGVYAWNFVVLGLLAVSALPLAEGSILGTGLNLDGFRIGFLGAVLAVGVLNYLPTRLGPAALLAGLGGTVELLKLNDPVGAPTLGLAVVPWTAALLLTWREWPESPFDQLWLDFRDRFGLVWGQRLREQFNRSAAHAGWPVVLRWRGLRLVPGSSPPDDDTRRAMLDALRALMKRFGPADDQ